jgi:hypothetical protein
MATFSASARVQITVEVDAGSSWGPDCTVAQVRDQAGTEAVRRIINTLAQGKMLATVIGAPKVLAVMHGETKEMRDRQ